MMQTMIMLVCASVLVASVTAWAVTLMRKWGLLEWLQVHGSRLVSELAGCDFCLSWWGSWVVVLPLLALTGWWWWLAVPFVSTMVSRWLLG